MKTLLQEETDKEFIDKQARLETFCERFNGISRKTVNKFSNRELKQYAELIKEFFIMYEKTIYFRESIELIRPDVIKGNYI